MKHCHFSILYNELPFLKAKLPFLYENFHQLIFFDLNIKTHTHSTDGSWEFLKAYPDPESKIVLIDQLDLSHITKYYGHSFVEKRKMFALGSRYVSDDMDVFWCDDMDEFFDVEWIKQVEEILVKYLGSQDTPPEKYMDTVAWIHQKYIIILKEFSFITLLWGILVSRTN